MAWIKDLGKLFDSLDIGLSRVLRYFYGGFLFVLLASVVHEGFRQFAKTNLMVVVFMAIVIGPGIYAIHRGIIIPLHHLLFCLVWRCDNNPVHWLGNKIGVKRGYKIAAYQKLRDELWKDSAKKNLDVEHAENGLVVMTAGLFLAAAIYEAFKCQSTCIWVFFILSALFFFGAYLRAFFQHSMECIEMKKREKDVREIVGTSNY